MDDVITLQYKVSPDDFTRAGEASSDVKNKLKQLAEGKYGIIYITEAVAAEIKEEIEKYQEQTLPAIIQIPGVWGNTGAGVDGVKKTVEQAVGSDILFSEKQ